MGQAASQLILDREPLLAAAIDSSRCREILDALPIAIYSTDAEGRLTHFNRAAVALAGRTPQLGVDEWCVALKLYRPDGTRLPHDQCPMAVALKERRAGRAEQVIAERPDGTRVWVELYPTPLFDAEGNLTGGINVLVDVTDRKRAEEAVGESQKDLADDFEAIERLQQVSMHLACAEDSDSLHERIMDAAVAIMRSDFASLQRYYPERGSNGEMRLLAFRGFDPDAAKFWEWVRADSGCTCGQALRTGKRGIATDVQTCDFMAATPDRAAYLQAGMRAAQSTPLFSRAGKLVGMISTHWKQPHRPSERDLRLMDVLARQAADWMERLQSEESLRRNAETLRALIEQSPLGIYTVDSDFRIAHVSQGALAAFQNVQPIIGRDFAEVMHTIWPESFAGEAVRIFRHVLDTGEPYVSSGLTEKRRDLRTIESYEWQVNRVTLADGRFGAVCYYFDTTRLQQTLHALDMAREQAEHANRAKDRFLAVLSHELRTPLSPVVMTVAAMETDAELPYSMREDVAMIRRNIELEVRLIDDLLDLSRVTSGKMRLQIQPTHVHPVLQQAVQNCVSETSAKRLNVRLDLGAERDMVKADPARLQQVFWNLIRNAAKFTPARGEIVIRTACTDDTVRIEVSDTGVGIPPEHLPKVFDAFEQGDMKTSRQFGGLGLGLAICKAVVDMHGGAITARSDGPGKGATFTVELAAASTANAQSPRVAQTPGREDAGGGNNPRVLLVEDHPDTADVLARLLRASGYLITTAGSVATALKLAGAETFDVVVSDLGLPDGTGYELMQQIRDRHGIKGIALSGYGMEEDQRRSREAGFIDHIVKPVNVAQLDAVIRRVAASHVSG